MTRKTLVSLLIILSIITLFNSAVLYINYKEGNRTVVIDIIRVFNEFKLKKDLETRVGIKLNDYKNTIDSLKAVYNALLQSNAKGEILSNVAMNIDTVQSRAQRAYIVSDKNINEQVWQRLNILLTEYGAQKDYSLVIGANGMGTVLYNEKHLDKTEELIKFINEKYALGH